MSDQFNNDFNDFFKQETEPEKTPNSANNNTSENGASLNSTSVNNTSDNGAQIKTKATKPKIKLGTGLKVFLILAAICAFAGFSPFFLKKHGSIVKTISKSSIKLNDIEDISSLKDTVKKIKINGKNGDYISKIYIEGVIQTKNKTYDQERLLKLIKKLQKDDSNKGIILYINSPGGTVFDSDNVYLELEKYKSAGKTVHAYIAQIGASGAYYISCAATNISANRNSLIGSIGVICGQFTDATELLSKLGIKSRTITSGKNKNMGNYNEPVNEEHVAIMQSIADETYRQFTEIVAESRSMSIEDVKKLADGRIYSARQSLDNGLIDNICSYEAAEKMLKRELDNPDIEVQDEKFEEKPSVYDFITGARTFINGAIVFLQTGSITEALRQSGAEIQTTAPLYYYPL